MTRGAELQDGMSDLVRRFLDDGQIQSLEEMAEWGYEPTSRQRREITKRINRPKNPLTFRDAFTDQFVKDKFGTATTHWNKLEKRLSQGMGNPCSLVLIGLPLSMVTFHEGKAALAEVQAAEDAANAEAEAEAAGEP